MVVGLTGGIGSGKTTVANYFRELGVPVYDSDKEAKKLMKSSKKLRRGITKLLGEEAYKGKKLNKKFIAKSIFSDADLLGQLNKLVHPVVKSHFKKWAEKQNTAYVIQEAAILFENGSYKNYDKMILVRAPIKIKIARLIQRDGSTEAAIRTRMKNQWKDAKKSKLSDFIIDNIDAEKTKLEVGRIHGQLLKISG